MQSQCSRRTLFLRHLVDHASRTGDSSLVPKIDKTFGFDVRTLNSESGAIAANDEIKEQILKTGIRKLERKTKVSHHTIDKLLKGVGVRRTLAKIVRQIQC